MPDKFRTLQPELIRVEFDWADSGIVLYGLSISTSTQCVALVCKELNIPYELVVVDVMAGEHKSNAVLQKHPFGQIPYIDDDGFVLYESRAICRYLAAKAGSALLPKQSDIEKWAKFETACSIEVANFDRIAAELAFEKLWKKMVNLGNADPVRTKKLEETLEAKLAGYERILSKQKYLAGDELTLADLFHLPYGHVFQVQLGYDFFKTNPNVARWWNDITSRPSWQIIKNGV